MRFNGLSPEAASNVLAASRDEVLTSPRRTPPKPLAMWALELVACLIPAAVLAWAVVA